MSRSSTTITALPTASRLYAVLAVLLLLGSSVPCLQAGAGGRWAILVAGVSGDPELQAQYLEELRKLHSVLQGPLQFAFDHVFVLADDSAKNPALVQYKSTRENLARVCKEIAAKAGKDDLVFVFIEGHGSYDEATYKLNLVGPDPSAHELAAMLYSIPAQHFIVVNATSASGGSLADLSGKGKIVITATKSGREGNLTHFGEYFVAALEDNHADTDKSGRVSMLEAFNYAEQNVEERYTRQGALQTEHPVLDDNGDGEGQSKPEAANGEGLLARTTYLDAGAPLITRGKLTPEQEKLAKEAQSIEQQIEVLKYRKAAMRSEEYDQQLEALLVKLAQINAKLQEK